MSRSVINPKMSEQDSTPATRGISLFKRLTFFDAVPARLPLSETSKHSSVADRSLWQGSISRRRLSVDWKRPFRQMWHVCERTPPFLRAFFSPRGIWSRDGRTLILGKCRRIAISFFPPLAHFLQRHYGLTGGCQSCGASCKLLFQCPHWNDQSHLCSVYEDRPNICRFFPITPADIRDRNLILKDKDCGFTFTKTDKK